MIYKGILCLVYPVLILFQQWSQTTKIYESLIKIEGKSSGDAKSKVVVIGEC